MTDQPIIPAPSTHIPEIPRGERLFATVLLDRSGSMSQPLQDDRSMTRAEAMRFGHNAMVEQLKAHPQAHRIRFARSFFNTTVPPYVRVSQIKNVLALEPMNYVPHGGTALYDAIATTLVGMQSVVHARPQYKHVYLAILSDGEDTDSHLCAADVRKLIEEKRAQGWTIEFYGMSPDVIRQAEEIGIPAGRTQKWEGTAQSVGRSSVIMGDAIAQSVIIDAHSPDSQP